MKYIKSKIGRQMFFLNFFLFFLKNMRFFIEPHSNKIVCVLQYLKYFIFRFIRYNQLKAFKLKDSSLPSLFFF